MIHGEIDSLRLTGLAATAWLCSEMNAHRIVHRFAEQRLPGPGRIACPFDMHVATALRKLPPPQLSETLVGPPYAA